MPWRIFTSPSIYFMYLLVFKVYAVTTKHCCNPCLALHIHLYKGFKNLCLRYVSFHVRGACLTGYLLLNIITVNQDYFSQFLLTFLSSYFILFVKIPKQMNLLSFVSYIVGFSSLNKTLSIFFHFFHQSYTPYI